MSNPLSPAAQAVLDAVVDGALFPFHLIARPMAVAALRALADQVVPEEDWPDQSNGFADWNLATERCEQRKNTRSEILAIANELKNHQ